MRKILGLFIISLFTHTLFAQLQVTNLLTENQSNPFGMDITTPRFSWQLSSSMRNTLQTAYEIKVTHGKAVVWNSGKVSSAQSVHLAYAGTALQSNQRYQWQVRVWDNYKNASAWSVPATFSMGLLTATDWKAQWMEAGFNEDTVNRPAQYFRKEFSISKKIKTATLYITSQGMYEAQLNGQRVGDLYLTPGWTSYNKRLQYQAYDVTALLKAGANATGVALGNGWYRGYLAWNDNKNIYGKKLALLYQLQIDYADGSTAVIGSDDSWKSNTGPIQYAEIYNGETYDARLEKKGWAAAGFNDADWKKVNTLNNNNTHLIATYNEGIKKH